MKFDHKGYECAFRRLDDYVAEIGYTGPRALFPLGSAMVINDERWLIKNRRSSKHIDGVNIVELVHEDSLV